MDVISVSPMRAASMAWQPALGTWLLTVVCKATYRLLPVTSELASEQEDPNEDENLITDPAVASVVGEMMDEIVKPFFATPPLRTSPTFFTS